MSRQRAYEDYKAGMMPKEIAEKYGVPANTVKSWLKRSKKEEAERVRGTEGAPQEMRPAPDNAPSEKLHPKGGAPFGNKNAVGNSGGAPKGNGNNLKHGIYRRMVWRRQDAEMIAAMQDMPHDEEELILIQLESLAQQEFDCNEAINRYRQSASGMMATRLVKTTEGGKTSVTTTADATSDVIIRLQRELTNIQKAKLKCIEILSAIRASRKLNGLTGNEGEEEAVTVYSMPGNGRNNG